MLKQIFLAKTPYLHLLISGILSATFFIGLNIANVFIWWMLYGEGEGSNEKYHQTANILLRIFPIGVISLMLFFLIFRNYSKGKLPQAKSFTISVIFIFILFLITTTLLSGIFDS